ncbi:MAG: bacteriophage abortive infection AbiH family protein [Lachnospiraceae bacterium]|nr:bacteriophage abortive infection AbiH family protein [Lachnospiraceae bacterium]
MSSLFIIGNGFDIAHEIPSKYSDFRKYIVKNYPEALQNKDKKVYLEDFVDDSFEELAAEFLLAAMDRIQGENWENFEDGLAHITVDEKFPEPNHKQDETDEEDNALMRNYLLYVDMLTNGVIICAEIWQDFFQDWIREVQIPIKTSNYFPRSGLKEIFKSKDNIFLTFNYTKTLEKIYGVKNVTHIHNYVGQKLVFGHGEDSVSYGENGLLISSFLDDMLMTLKKDTDVPMIKNKKFFKKLSKDIDKVYSYGFSYGKVDSVYIKRIVQSISPDAVWLFTTYEAQDREALRIKKTKLRNYGFKGTFDVYEG